MRDDIGPVLFVVPSATRTGSPMVILHFLRWLRRNTTIDFEVLLAEDGPLCQEFEAVAPTRVLWDASGPLSWQRRVMSKLDYEGLHRSAKAVRGARFRTKVSDRDRFRTVYLNSAATWIFTPFFRRSPAVLIGHTHELTQGLHFWLPAGVSWLSHALELDGVVAASDAVVDALVRGGLPGDRIRRHYEFIDTSGQLPSAEVVAAARGQLGIPDGTPIVGGAGYPMWRKGPDLFVQLARSMVSRRPDAPVAFVWVGGGPDVSDFWQVEHEIRTAGLEGRVHFIETQADPFAWFQAFDVFAMTSRQDPFPLVCLEAAWLGKPVVCFDRAGGAPELLADDRGAIVPYLDVEAMATRVWEFLDDPSLRAQVGTRASAWIREHHDVEVAAPALLEEIERIYTEARRR